MNRAFERHAAYMDQAWRTLQDTILLKTLQGKALTSHKAAGCTGCRRCEKGHPSDSIIREPQRWTGKHWEIVAPEKPKPKVVEVARWQRMGDSSTWERDKQRREEEKLEGDAKLRRRAKTTGPTNWTKETPGRYDRRLLDLKREKEQRERIEFQERYKEQERKAEEERRAEQERIEIAGLQASRLASLMAGEGG